MHLVAGDDRAHTRRCACVDEVARGQPNQSGQMGDDLRYIPDELVEIRILAGLTVDLYPNRAAVEVTDFAGGVDRRAWGRVVESFAHVPGAPLIAGGEL